MTSRLMVALIIATSTMIAVSECTRIERFKSKMNAFKTLCNLRERCSQKMHSCGRLFAKLAGKTKTFAVQVFQFMQLMDQCGITLSDLVYIRSIIENLVEHLKNHLDSS